MKKKITTSFSVFQRKKNRNARVKLLRNFVEEIRSDSQCRRTTCFRRVRCLLQAGMLIRGAEIVVIETSSPQRRGAAPWHQNKVGGPHDDWLPSTATFERFATWMNNYNLHPNEPAQLMNSTKILLMTDESFFFFLNSINIFKMRPVWPIIQCIVAI